MDRMACVDIRALPLQLLLRRHPDWAPQPAVVVDRDKPQGVIQWANEAARARRILPGMRYAAGLSLSRHLQGGVVPGTEVAEAIEEITECLWCFSPRIEPAEGEPGVFWVDAAGLDRLYPSLASWAAQMRDALAEAGFRAVAAVGFSRFGSYAAARAGSENRVFQTLGEEQAHVRSVRIEHLGFAPGLRDTLLKLGIETLGAFMDLPAGGIRRRFGPEAEAWHRRARGACWTPLTPTPPREALERTGVFDYPERNHERIQARLAQLLDSLLRELAERHERVESFWFALKLDDGNHHREELAPATPTTDPHHLLMLARLRVEGLILSAGVVEVTAGAAGAGEVPRQLELFADAPHRQNEAVHGALAKLRAQLGNDAVVYARLGEGHLPEARYYWASMQNLAAPKPAAVAVRPLVRRIYARPKPLPPCHRHEPDGWLIAGLAEGPVEEVVGPYIVSGGWWLREVSRAYHYVRTRSGRWLWIYYDHKRRRWFQQGEVQ